MSSPLVITQEELRSSVGIGASEVATILFESPWQQPFELWQIKTGRAKKPPTTPAMQFGIDMEPEAFEAYCRITGTHEKWERGVAARHPQMEFLRAIADGWCEANHWGVEIKVPTSRSLIDSMTRGVVPRHYLLQMAAEMAVFAVDSWDFYVYDAAAKTGELCTVTMEQEFEDGLSLGEFWETAAVPALKEFWEKVQADSWDSWGTAKIDEQAWRAAMLLLEKAVEQLAVAQEEKDRADARLKRLLGNSKFFVDESGCKASWTYYKPLAQVTVNVDPDKLPMISETLAGLRGVTGVREVKTKVLPESYRFIVRRQGQ
jgi:putative phage-type endonuclease